MEKYHNSKILAIKLIHERNGIEMNLTFISYDDFIKYLATWMQQLRELVRVALLYVP